MNFKDDSEFGCLWFVLGTWFKQIAPGDKCLDPCTRSKSP